MALSESKRKSNAKWDAANLKRLSLAVPVDLFQRMSEHAAEKGESMNGFIKRAIQELLDNEE